MADGTKIEWTDATWNPVTGCSVVSPGCTNCYAMRLAGSRMKHHPSRAGLTEPSKAGPVWNGRVRFNEEWLDQPLGWKKRRRIFVCAHGDLFHENVPDEWIDRVFAVMALAPQHTFQVLTKRAARMRRYFEVTGSNDDPDAVHQRVLNAAYDLLSDNRAEEEATRLRDLCEATSSPLPLPNCWLGVSVEDQARADERIPDLLDTPATVRFVSAEPLLGPVRLSNLYPIADDGLFVEGVHGCTPRIDWVIAGGESGPGARPMRPDWARALRDQCAAAGVPFFFKQWGTWIDADQRAGHGFYPPGTGPDHQLTYDEAAAIAREQRLSFEYLSDGRTVFRIGQSHPAQRWLDLRRHSEFPA